VPHNYPAKYYLPYFRKHRALCRAAQANPDAPQPAKIRIYIFSGPRIFLTNWLFKYPETGAVKNSRKIKKP
jgi:hypothetical protein